MRLTLLAALLCLAACRPTEPPRKADLSGEARAIARRETADPRVVTLAVQRADDFFTARFDRIERAVDDLFAFRGKWRAAFWGREDYERFVRRTLEKRLMKSEHFERDVLGAVREDFARASSAAENRTLAAAWALTHVEAPALEFASFAARYAALVDELLPRIGTDTAMNVVTLVGSEGIAVGASAALATAGLFAANSWWNCGISLAIGVVAAIVIDAFVGDFCESEARTRLYGELARLRFEATTAVRTAVSSAWAAHARRLEEAVAAAVEGSL